MRLSFLLPLALIPQTCAWGAVGHEVVATVAQMHLHPSVMPKLCHILHYTDDCHLAPVAAWADRVRNLPKYRWTGPLHYIGATDDYPSTTCAFPGPQGWEGRTHINVLNAIRNTTTVLHDFEVRKADIWTDAYTDDDDDEPGYVQDAVKFLIHFVGDMHMPLHLTGRHRGGNNDKVAFDGRTTNIHTVWDSLLISERLRTLSHNYSRPLPLPDVEAHLRGTIYDPYIRRLVWEGILGKWKDELESWLVCPSSVSASTSAPRRPLSTWQSVLSLFSFSSASKGKHGQEQGETDGGLGVDDDVLCPYAWAKPIHQLNCEIVFPKELDLAPLDRLYDVTRDSDGDGDGGEGRSCGCDCSDASGLDAYDTLMARTPRKSPYLELYTPEYAGVIKERWIIEKLLTQAGVRLAAILNGIFADLDNEDVEGRLYLSIL